MKITSAVVLTVACLLNLSPASAQQPMGTEEVGIAVQAICPVSGLTLGDHGPPIKAMIGGQQMYLCCEGCKNSKVKQEHWATIHQNFARAQGVCFVMENELPKTPEWTIVNGRLFYVCCPPCIEKIKADPATYVQKLDAAYAAYVANEEGR